MEPSITINNLYVIQEQSYTHFCLFLKPFQKNIQNNTRELSVAVIASNVYVLWKINHKHVV